jgi:hypothetical protein
MNHLRTEARRSIEALGFTALALSAAVLAGCSMDVIPVSSSRVKSAKLAEQPLLRGPDAPGAFRHTWEFTQAEGHLFDPTELEFTSAGVRFTRKAATVEKGKGKSKVLPNAERVGVFVTQKGPWFVALDSFQEVVVNPQQGFVRYQLSPDSSTWYYFQPEKGWTAAGPNYQQANSSQEIQAQIGKFHLASSEGTLVLKAFVVAPQGSETIQLRSVEVQGVAPNQDGWD